MTIHQLVGKEVSPDTSFFSYWTALESCVKSTMMNYIETYLVAFTEGVANSLQKRASLGDLPLIVSSNALRRWYVGQGGDARYVVGGFGVGAIAGGTRAYLRKKKNLDPQWGRNIAVGALLGGSAGVGAGLLFADKKPKPKQTSKPKLESSPSFSDSKADNETLNFISKRQAEIQKILNQKYPATVEGFRNKQKDPLFQEHMKSMEEASRLLNNIQRRSEIRAQRQQLLKKQNELVERMGTGYIPDSIIESGNLTPDQKSFIEVQDELNRLLKEVYGIK